MLRIAAPEEIWILALARITSCGWASGVMCGDRESRYATATSLLA
jgi:hypothetical protein